MPQSDAIPSGGQPRGDLDERLVGTEHIARMLSVDVETVRRWSRSKEIPIAGTLPGGARRYLPSEVLEWFKRRGA